MADFAKGIDVSYHRGDIAWDVVRGSGVVFGIAKVTEGTTFKDPKFTQNWLRMRVAGLVRGAYHFFRPDMEPRAQAQHYLEITRPFLHEFDMPPVLDVENSPSFVRDAFARMSVDQRVAAVRVWLAEVQRETGRQAIVYTNPDTWVSALGDTTAFVQHPLWLAHYGVSGPSVPARNWNGFGWTFWQFTDRGQIPGVNLGQPPVDVNYFRGDERQLLGWLGIPKVPRAIEGLTNAQVLAAFRAACEKHGLRLGDLLALTRMSYLAEARYAELSYDGAVPRDLPLPEELADSLATQIDLLLADSSQGIAPYSLYSLTNQQVINGFYRAASWMGMGGWSLLHAAGLSALANARSQMYRGPRLDEIATLSPAQVRALKHAFGLGDSTNGDEETVPREAIYPGVTNQMMINAVYRLARLRGLSGWGLLSRLGLEWLVRDRGAVYNGPALADLPAGDDDRRVLAQTLGLSNDSSVSPVPYPGLLNQDMINAFYQAAKILGDTGWGLLTRADLIHLAASAEARNAPYVGPKVEELPNMGEAEKQALLKVLSA